MGDGVLLAYDYPLLGAFWTVMWIFLWVLWLILVFRVVVDVFRDDSLHGLAKAAWLLFVVVLPFLGVFVYLIVRGRSMGEREVRQQRDQQKAVESYLRETVRGGHADDLAKLSTLREKGDLTDEEFARAKEKLLH